MDLTPEETQKIEKVIKQSKSDLKLYPKGVWYKTTGTKLRKVLKEIMASKEVRDALSDVVKKWILNV